MQKSRTSVQKRAGRLPRAILLMAMPGRRLTMALAPRGVVAGGAGHGRPGTSAEERKAR